MARRKQYGQSRVNSCPFCGDSAYSRNPQNVPVCKNHSKTELPDLKCVCGGWLDIKEGKWGSFYICLDCGPVNQRKMLEINGGAIRDAATAKKQYVPKTMKNAGKMTLQEQVREKIRKGEPLTSDELEFL